MIVLKGLISASPNLLICLSGVAFLLRLSSFLREKGVGTRKKVLNRMNAASTWGHWQARDTVSTEPPWALDVPWSDSISNILFYCVKFTDSYRNHMAHLGLKNMIPIGMGTL